MPALNRIWSDHSTQLGQLKNQNQQELEQQTLHKDREQAIIEIKKLFYNKREIILQKQQNQQITTEQQSMEETARTTELQWGSEWR